MVYSFTFAKQEITTVFLPIMILTVSLLVGLCTQWRIDFCEILIHRTVAYISVSFLGCAGLAFMESWVGE